MFTKVTLLFTEFPIQTTLLIRREAAARDQRGRSINKIVEKGARS